MRTVAVLGALSVVCAWAAAGCGGTSQGSAAAQVETVSKAAQTSANAPPGSILARLNADPAPDSALVMGSSDFAVGENRIIFLIVKSNGDVVDATRARVLVAKGGLDALPTIDGTAENVPVGITESQGQELESQRLWVSHLELDSPGQYSILVEPAGASIQGIAQIEVADESKAPPVGAPAIPSDNPTVETAFPDRITTARPPDVDLLRSSIAQAVRAKAPFVVTFATPEFCTSRVCGPVVDVVDAVRRRFVGTGVRFIHVEIFQDNDPSLGFNRWVKEWNLPTEPWTFVVDRSGIIRDRFEGLVTVGELEQSVRRNLVDK